MGRALSGTSEGPASSLDCLRPPLRTVIVVKLSCGLLAELIWSSGMTPTGYRSPKYVESLREFGQPLPLARTGGFLLERTIPGTVECDAMGPYPLFCGRDWSALPQDLADLEGRVVSIVLVTDPFGPDDPTNLAHAFSHGLGRYKDHHVIDLQVPLEQSVCRHHRRNARWALGRLTVEELADPVQYVDTWCGLYAELIRRHGLRGMSRFSRRAFELQFAVPGLVAFRAVDEEGDTVGMLLWYCQGEVGYYHLGAYSPKGYATKASYALIWSSAERLKNDLRWLNLGAGAGASCDGTDGLTRFKMGWSTSVRPTYLGRHIARPDRYEELSPGGDETGYFPAYRAA
jgi:Acetyltransferase (GNAT) domain